MMLDVVMPANNLVRWVILKAVASFPLEQFCRAVLICFYGIVAKCYEPLNDHHCNSDNICYVMVLDCGAACLQFGLV